ncbi:MULTISPECIES: hypothetical protein [Ensifer]|uniref:Uncharacterized protein n=1 Tax=Ensifer adhaerens TaxID=106592 RepID=A0A0L8BFW7_ENSAD|nr:MULTISPECIES: hypothetical protein [Ensifer]KOF13562.1 hypothetical protein AC244_30420 [Ensifer adhaerens]OCP23149.1 hypothetical protein BC361_23295 [Ensifer sp. LC54]OCP24977.1 hypothetical protein BC363_21475 [Ensifer sp. LC384]OCP38605.1 hypothetical protein BC360_00585 [Ensifer sp. LC163]
MTQTEEDLELSELSGEFADDDVVVHIRISRPTGSNLDWTLEVIDEEGYSTVWEDSFPTDREAYEEFLATIERDGIHTFTEHPVQTLH